MDRPAADGRADRPRAGPGRARGAPASVLRSLTGASGGDGRAAVLGVLAEHGLSPAAATATRLFGEWSPGRRPGDVHRRRAGHRPGRRPGAPDERARRGGQPAVRAAARTAPRRGRGRRGPPSCRSRWPNRCWTCGSMPPRHPVTRSRPGSTSRSSTSKGASARTSWRSMRGSWTGGVERGLDATTTRNLMGNAYPQPGLYGKFYDQDAQPLVEVVRDTVGRHDTFALACNAKYYEDMGYPGHVNCTDNFNGAARPVRHRGAPRLARAELLLQHLVQRLEPAVLRRALVAAGRLRAAAGDDRPGLRLVGLPRRHRSRQRLEPDRHPRPRLPGRAEVLHGDRAPRHPGRRAEADPRNRPSSRAGRS